MVKKKLPFITATAAIALISGFVFRSPDAGTSVAGMQEAGAVPEFTAVAMTVCQQATAETEPPEPDQPEPRTKLLESAELDAETQWSIYAECGQDPQLFCTVMAIAARETGYDTNAIGDGGNSVGMLQINTPWHSERLEALGITDLTDPAQSARVAVDILMELTDTYGYGTASHAQLMSYNMGAKGAKKAMAAGNSSSEYSRSVMEFYQNYMEEMEVQE